MLSPRIRTLSLSTRSTGNRARLAVHPCYPISHAETVKIYLSSSIYRDHSSHSLAETRLRLMPLGGSVTYGVGSSDGNGYRRFLHDMLLADGFQVRFVGSRKSGTMFDGDNEGWRGYRLDQIDNKARRSVPTLLPNIFTINAGSNDCIQDFQIDEFGRRMGDLVEYFWHISPSAAVILSTLLVNADQTVNSRVSQVNDQLRQLVDLKAFEQKRIVLADMNSPEGPNLGDLVDGTHPGDQGYRKMAAIWFNAIRKAHAKAYF